MSVCPPREWRAAALPAFGGGLAEQERRWRLYARGHGGPIGALFEITLQVPEHVESRRLTTIGWLLVGLLAVAVIVVLALSVTWIKRRRATSGS